MYVFNSRNGNTRNMDLILQMTFRKFVPDIHLEYIKELKLLPFVMSIPKAETQIQGTLTFNKKAVLLVNQPATQPLCIKDLKELP